MKQEDRHDEGFHAGGGFGESVFESGDASKDLGESDQEVGRGLDGDVNAVGRGVIGCRASQRSIVAWSGGVDQMLRDGCISHGECRWIHISKIGWGLWRERNLPQTKPMVMRVTGRKGMPIFRRAGYTSRSMIGIKMMIVKASMFCMRSLGIP